MLRVYKRLALIMSVVWVSFMIPFLSVQATELKPSVKLSNSSGVVELLNLVNSYSSEVASGFSYLSFSMTGTDGVIISVDTCGYNELSNMEKSKIMEYTLRCISNSSLVAVDRTKLYNFIAGTDSEVSAVVRQLSADSGSDFYTAYSYIKPFSGLVGTVLALFSIGLFFGLVTSFLIDISYIAIPLVNIFLSAGAEGKPNLVTVEAYKAYLQGVDKDNKRDVLLLYLGKKWKQIVVVCICILYLAGGRVWALLADLIDLFSGVLD